MNLGSARASTEDWKLTIERDKLTKAGYTSIFREKVCRAYRDRPELSPHARSIAQGRGCHRLEAWPTGELYPQSPRERESDRQPRGPVSIHLRAPGPISPCMPARCAPPSSSLAHGATESYLIHLHELTTACGTQVRVRISARGLPPADILFDAGAINAGRQGGRLHPVRLVLDRVPDMPPLRNSLTVV